MNKRHYEHTLPNIRGSLSNTYRPALVHSLNCTYFLRQRKIDLITSKNNSL